MGGLHMETITIAETIKIEDELWKQFLDGCTELAFANLDRLDEARPEDRDQMIAGWVNAADIFIVTWSEGGFNHCLVIKGAKLLVEIPSEGKGFALGSVFRDDVYRVNALTAGSYADAEMMKRDYVDHASKQ
jgi:hypothetical protein